MPQHTSHASKTIFTQRRRCRYETKNGKYGHPWQPAATRWQHADSQEGAGGRGNYATRTALRPLAPRAHRGDRYRYFNVTRAIYRRSNGSKVRSVGVPVSPFLPRTLFEPLKSELEVFKNRIPCRKIGFTWTENQGKYDSYKHWPDRAFFDWSGEEVRSTQNDVGQL